MAGAARQDPSSRPRASLTKTGDEGGTPGGLCRRPFSKPRAASFLYSVPGYLSLRAQLVRFPKATTHAQHPGVVVPTCGLFLTQRFPTCGIHALSLGLAKGFF